MSDCTCTACLALAAEYDGDTVLLAFVRRRLLKRGWATSKTDAEKAYVLAHATWAQVGAERLRGMPAHMYTAGQQQASGGEVASDTTPTPAEPGGPR